MRPIRTLSRVAATILASALAVSACAPSGGFGVTTLRAVPHADLKVLDPIATTAYITRSHGYLVYDTLFSLDQNLEPQPQMVDNWSTSKNGLVWTFTLRDGLAWHDDKPVTAEDCVASLRRWGKVDGMGQALFARTRSIKAVDNKTFKIHLKSRYDRILYSLAKLSSNVPFMMPASVAATSPGTPITSAIGSGPFIFKANEWERGRRVVYVRNKNYVPRKDPTPLGAGAKIAKVDRIEWISYKDQNAAVDALIAGEVDYLESPSTALVPKLSNSKNVTLAYTDPLGNIGMAVFNHRIAPFNKRAVRRAVLMAMDQSVYMKAALGDPTFWRTCYSVYACDTTYASDAGSSVMQKADIDAARRALRRSGYRGETVVILNPTDSPVISAFTKVTVEVLQQIGMKVDVQNMTWAQLLERRMNQGSTAKGGWNMFHTWWIAADLTEPTQIAYSGNPRKGWIGWPKSRRAERLRARFAATRTERKRAAIATELQKLIWKNATFGVLGQFFEPIAYRKALIGQQSPIQMYYNLGFAK